MDARPQAVDHEVEPEVEVGQRLQGPLDRAEAYGLAGGLLLEGVPEDVVDQRPRRDRDELVGDLGGREDLLHLRHGCRGAEAEGPDGRHDVRAVRTGEQRPAQLGADLAQAVGPLGRRTGSGAPGEDLVGDGGEQCLLAGEVVVDRARLHVELGTEPAHRERGQAVGVQEVDGVRDHVAAVMSHTPSSVVDGVDAAVATTLT